MKRFVKIFTAAAVSAALLTGCASWTAAHDAAMFDRYTCANCWSIDRYPVKINASHFCNGCAENCNDPDYATLARFDSFNRPAEWRAEFVRECAAYETPAWCDFCGSLTDAAEMRYHAGDAAELLTGWACSECFDIINAK